MNKKLAIASAMLALGVGSSAVHALDPNGVALAGSDTLFDVTTDMIHMCPNAGTLSYAGGGSGAGENAMTSRGTTHQYIAPMSRFLGTGPTKCPTTAQGYNIGLDGISIVRKQGNGATPPVANACDTAAYTRTISYGSGLSYTFRDFRDVLRIVYGGFDNAASGAILACDVREPTRADISKQNCNSPLRQAIVNNWGNLFQDATCANSETCTQLKHAFRRSDRSGTTDTFLTLLAMPKVGRIQPSPTANKPFCNGDDQEDNDPIRRACSGDGYAAGEQVCQPRDIGAKAFDLTDQSGSLTKGSVLATDYEPATQFTGDLGVVQDILVPEGVSAAVSHNVTACSFSKFALTHMDPASKVHATRCPNGTSQVLQKCLYPQDASGNFGCLSWAANHPLIGELKKIDGRVYNLILRSGLDPDSNIVKDKNSEQVLGAFYRMHDTLVIPASTGVPAGGVACTESDSTRQIGCLVQASPCSIGFAGREAADNAAVGNNDVLALKVGLPDNSTAIKPTDATIQQLLAVDPLWTSSSGTACTAGGTLSTRYSLARRLWLNSVDGFADANAATDQKALAACFADRGLVDPLITKWGFTLLPQPAGLSAGQTCASVGPGNANCALLPISQPCL